MKRFAAVHNLPVARLAAFDRHSQQIAESQGLP
jgi:hypothetical protein